MGGILGDGLHRPHRGYVHERHAAEVEHQRSVMLGADALAYVVTQIGCGAKTQWPTEIKVGKPVTALLEQRGLCV